MGKGVHSGASDFVVSISCLFPRRSGLGAPSADTLIGLAPGRGREIDRILSESGVPCSACPVQTNGLAWSAKERRERVTSCKASGTAA